MSLGTIVRTTVGKHNYVENLAGVLAAAFKSDPLARANVLHLDSLPNDAVIPHERWLKYWIPSIKTKVEAGGQIIEAGNWAAASLWFPPGVKKPPLGSPDELPALIIEYVHKFENVKKHYLGERQYWYLNIIGRDPNRSELGVVRALFEPYLQKAQDEGLPVFLEATTVHARDVYAHFGFQTVEVVVVGEGHVDAKGNKVIGGSGLTLYGMIAEPRPR